MEMGANRRWRIHYWKYVKEKDLRKETSKNAYDYRKRFWRSKF